MKTLVAVAQTDSVLGDIEKNISNHSKFINEAIKKKSNIIVFPELSLTGYTLKDIVHEIAISKKNKNILNPLIKLSDKISILVGLVEESEEYGFYNSAFLLENKKVIPVHRKIYLPTYGMFEEGRYFSPGKNLEKIKSKKCNNFGVLICEDSWHSSLSNILAHKGAEIIFSLTASPIRVSSKSKIEKLDEVNCDIQKTISRLNNVFSVFVNRVGIEDGVNFFGASQIINPFGEVIAKAKYLEEDLIFGEINSEEIKKSRIASRHFIDDSLLVTQKLINDILNNKGKSK